MQIRVQTKSMSKRQQTSNTGATTPKRKAVFNPTVAEARASKFLQLRRQLCDAYEAFTVAAQKVVDSGQFVTVLENCTVAQTELCLVSYLGLEGVDCLRLATDIVPVSFLQLREQYVARIVKSVVTDKPNIDAAKCRQLMTLLKTNYFTKRRTDPTCYSEELRMVSESTGKAHTAFLAPPVSSCINPSCRKYQDPNSLYIHHSEVNTTIYDLRGISPASKVALRCKECSTIYNYAKYGRKSGNGEMYYDEMRSLVEVSDVVYCSRDLHSLYCELW